MNKIKENVMRQLMAIFKVPYLVAYRSHPWFGLSRWVYAVDLQTGLTIIWGITESFFLMLI